MTISASVKSRLRSDVSYVSFEAACNFGKNVFKLDHGHSDILDV